MLAAIFTPEISTNKIMDGAVWVRVASTVMSQEEPATTEEGACWRAAAAAVRLM